MNKWEAFKKGAKNAIRNVWNELKLKWNRILFDCHSIYFIATFRRKFKARKHRAPDELRKCFYVRFSLEIRTHYSFFSCHLCGHFLLILFTRVLKWSCFLPQRNCNLFVSLNLKLFSFHLKLTNVFQALIFLSLNFLRSFNFSIHIGHTWC